MTVSKECSHTTESSRLVRQGTSRDQRLPAALTPDNPAFPLVDERALEHRLVFAKAYAAYLKYYDSGNVEVGDWQPFFSNDVSVRLAVAAVQDVAAYQADLKEQFEFLKNISHLTDQEKCKDSLGFLFSSVGSLAWQLDLLKEGLPAEIALKGTLQSLITSRLAPSFKQLMLYYRDAFTHGSSSPPTYLNDIAPAVTVLGATPRGFNVILKQGLSADWIAEENAPDWPAYLIRLHDPSLHPTTGIYGNGPHLHERINHCATHNLFTSIFDQFLKTYARIVEGAKQELQKTLTESNGHEPHYALFLAFLKLLQLAMDELNGLTGKHLDFYYRNILQLTEKRAEPAHVHLLVELAKQTPHHVLTRGTLFRGGKDDLGREVRFAADADLVANQATVASLMTVYRHVNNGTETLTYNNNRLFASPAINSDDGLGAPLTNADSSWHPFFNKTCRDGQLAAINMPKADVGFAVASHYLWLAGGTRTITLTFALPHREQSHRMPVDFSNEHLKTDRTFCNDDFICRLTTAKGWLDVAADRITRTATTLTVKIIVSGASPPIVPYDMKIHGGRFTTHLPLLTVALKHRDDAGYIYPALQDIVFSRIELKVIVENFKKLSVSNDFGPIDLSKPFHPFGASPLTGSALIIGSKEVFSKAGSGTLDCTLHTVWQTKPEAYGSAKQTVAVTYLADSAWQPSGGFLNGCGLYDTLPSCHLPANAACSDIPDFTPDQRFGTDSRNGFFRLQLETDFGRSAYQTALNAYLSTLPNGKNFPGNPPAGPILEELSLSYTATQTIALQPPDQSIGGSQERFFHLAPFGQAEQWLHSGVETGLHLLPQFSEAEFYIGLTGLKPPRNVALLFQVSDGTANPLLAKPADHIQWSFLSSNQWTACDSGSVQDKTGGLLNSGIVTLAVPAGARSDNTLLPPGMHWLRASVTSACDAVCRLRLVAAQAVEATFVDNNNDPDYTAQTAPAGSIGKLAQPVAEVKKISQPFPPFGGRGKETTAAFYTRVSERLRHKDRAVTIWDCERLILEAFPQIYRVTCLNHTWYEPDGAGIGIYRELAPGHITVVTIPDLTSQNIRDPLRPYTSLALLDEIKAFLAARLSHFATLHVCNPVFEEVRLECSVRFREGCDETFSRNTMKNAISRFLSPWAFPGGGTPSFSGRIHAAALINLMEELPFVDYVTDVRLFQDGLLKNGTIEGTTAVSILVSARDHDITVINPLVAQPPQGTCGCEA